METTTPIPTTLTTLTSQIVSAHVAHNAVGADKLPELIRSVHSTLGSLSETPQDTGPLKPAVPIKKSVTPDYIICLEDGKKLKVLKRYLRSQYDMTPEQYRQRWGLPADYPMVAPNYAEQRSQFAKKIGLGKARGDR
jgi:predicted transcriptional regulator